jgi:hypothetical protein
MTPEMRAYTLAFGRSLLDALSERAHDVRKALRKTSSDHEKPVERDRGHPRVRPTSFVSW